MDPGQSAERVVWLPEGRPRCRHGFDCYRRNQDHKASYSHPVPNPNSTDVVVIGDSDDEVATEAVKKQDRREEKEDANTPHHESDAEMARRLQMEELASHRADRKRKSETEEDDDASKHKRTATDQRAAGFAGATPPKFIADGVGFRLLFTQSIPMKWNENCVRLKDVIAGEIQWAVLTNYMFDMEWLLSDIPQLLSIPKVAILHHAKQLDPSALPPNFQCYAPPVEAWGTHHSKCLLLGYATGLRVVVITANHVYGDHYEMTDAVWAQDFPLKPVLHTTPSPTQAVKRAHFEEELVEYFNMCGWRGMEVPGVGRIGVSQLRRFDFSQARARLIASVPGRHSGAALHKFGHMKLRAVLGKEVFATRFRYSPLVWQCTSIG